VRAKREEEKIPLNPITAGVYIATMMVRVRERESAVIKIKPRVIVKFMNEFEREREEICICVYLRTNIISILILIY
jgi:hypothetical protein